MGSTGGIVMGSDMDTTMECGPDTVLAIAQEGPRLQGTFTETGPVAFVPPGRPEIRPIMPETGQVVLTRVQFQTTGLLRVTGPQPGTGQLPVRPLQETGLVAEPGPSPQPGKIMYMPEETGMYTVGIIMAIFSSEAMVSGVVADHQDPQTVQEANSR